ncbi:methyltransferase domain-containing protein [Actinacidiphila acididurans]|uniref:Protein-L-isoaspartate O-methyltransferase n=1 Tax=Actinacidiphila acididurans TaxID=2784346 RepID=A0ABS2TPY9_9ACTN|nr:methyltransferase domain-containing protein [Actinacidiphila acididurans]MBM9505397.1 methyltransferase domain-containing protein [Actinacidiphila acididurans]
MTLTHEEEGRAGDELARLLLEAGALTPEWAGAFGAVPRALFLPDLIWPYDMTTGRSVPVSRGEDPETWERTAYADVPVVTQWDDGEHEGTEPGTVATSSASMPYVVAVMLRDLAAGAGMRVLEIGTGTGWNAALLAHRLGDANVVSVEIDPAVAERARAALKRAGLSPEVVLGDGAAGWPEGAPYDRVIATAGVRALPPSWLAQTRPGGVILAPWGTHYSDQDALVRLTVAEDGSASGTFRSMVEFMKLRAQRLDWDRFHEHVPAFPGDADVSRTKLTRADLGDRYEPARFVTGLCVPDCAHVVNPTGPNASRAWFFDLRTRSWAAVDFRTGRPWSTVHQSGPRRLWDEVEQALTWWSSQGSPALTRFGLTVAPDGTPHPWLDHPDHPLPFG